MTKTYITKVLIIGSGPAGYTAAIYAARAGLKPLLVSGLQEGGQMTITSDVENYPGFPDAIQGPKLMEDMKKQAENVGTEMVSDIIASIDLKSSPKRAVNDSGDVYLADSVIIATGAQAKWLGLPSEKQYQGGGVSGCATCDGFFFRGKEVVVVGGGNTAVEEAIFLSKLASKVTVIHRRDEFRAEKIQQERLFSNPKINVVWDSTVDEIIGNGQTVSGVKIKNIKTNKITDLKADGVFIAIGHKPSSEIFQGQIDTDAEGYIVTKPGSTLTNIPGVFAAGDVMDKIYRQAVTAAGLGCQAAIEADKYLSHLTPAPSQKANPKSPKIG